MTSQNDDDANLDRDEQDRIERDELIWQLREQGYSIRAIAGVVGLSPTQVFRITAAMAEMYGSGENEPDEDGPEDAGDDDEVVIDTYEPAPPFTFVGLAIPEDRRGNPLRDLDGRKFPPQPRAIDGRGVSIATPALEVLRWCMHAEAEGDYDAAERVQDDWARQLAEAGVRRDDRGRWTDR
jgi:hypothetical protein